MTTCYKVEQKTLILFQDNCVVVGRMLNKIKFLISFLY